jgi:aryl carrier-like protein
VLPDGRLICLGRTDSQIKLRGFRIELGEVEAALEKHPAVQAAAVIARNHRLLAYFVAKHDAVVTVSDLRHWTESKLPPHMVPGLFIPLADLPRTLNGKVDRKRLPEPPEDRPSLDRGYVSPRTPLEETLAGTWCQVLGLNRVGVQDNFFELGGHSLLAMQVVARLGQELGTELTIASIFENPTVEAFALHLTTQMAGNAGLSDAELDAILAEAAGDSMGHTPPVAS